MIVTIDDLRRVLPELCELYDVAHVDAYGSIARNEQDEDSDIDLIVEFREPRRHALSKRFFGLLHALEDRFGRQVDLLTEKSLSNPYLIRQIERDRVRVYG